MKNMNKKTKGFVILAVIFAVVLIASIIISSITGLVQTKKIHNVEFGVQELTLNAKDFFKVEDDVAAKITFDTSAVNLNAVGEYEVIASYNGKDYTIKVVVEDTTAPEVDFVNRYVFTNDVANTEFSTCVDSCYDASEFSYELIRFERTGDLVEMTDDVLTDLTNSIPLPCVEEELLAIGTEDIPTEEGIYRSVLKATDIYGNASYEEVYVIVDKTPAVINEVEDLVHYVSVDELNNEPTLDMSLYKAVDNADGFVTSDKMTISTSVRDENLHEWLVNVSYTDRAGNESTGEFLITVKEAKNNTASSTTPGGNGGNGGGSNSGGGTGNLTTYDPADTNKDGVVDTEEELGYITPEKQACINAGYGVVVELNGGTKYAVLMPDALATINGKIGGEILDEYLAARGLKSGKESGAWINSDKGWYWYVASDIQPIS